MRSKVRGGGIALRGMGVALRGGGIALRGMGAALAKGGRAFGGAETYGEELAEAKQVKSGKVSPKQFVKKEKAEKHKGEELKSLAKQAKAIKSGKVSPESYAKMEASEPMKKGGKVEKVMHEFKTGKLRSGSKKGPVVKSRKQAIAIALSEAGKSKKK